MAEKILQGKVAVVTGAGRGIGRAIAIALADHGAKVVVNDLGAPVEGSDVSSAAADGVAAEIVHRGGEAIANYDSVATMEGGRGIVRAAVSSFGSVHILVTPAGNLAESAVFDMTEEQWNAVIDVHLKGTFTVARHAPMIMREQRWGRIIPVTSVAGLWGNRGQANYAAAKSGIAGLARSLARDLGWYGITVNCISPGADTRMMAAVAKEPTDQPSDPAGRPGPVPRQFIRPPEAIAPLVVWLASDGAAQVNGRIFHISGGILGLMSEPAVVRSITQREGPWTVEDIAAIFPTTLGMDLTPNIVWGGWRPGVLAPPGTWGKGWK